MGIKKLILNSLELLYLSFLYFIKLKNIDVLKTLESSCILNTDHIGDQTFLIFWFLEKKLSIGEKILKSYPSA